MIMNSVSGNSFQGVNGVAQTAGAGLNRRMDSVSKGIQNQISNAQERLQSISEDKDMSLEEKMKKRQEIQQEINNLNQQLRQHQIAKRKEQQAGGLSMEDMTGGSRKSATARAGSQARGLSQAGMQALISADSSLKQARAQGSVATEMEGRARILKSEIKLDRGNTEDKEAALAEIEQKALDAATSQMNTLADAGKAVKEAGKEEQQNGMDNKVRGTEEDKERTDKNAQDGQEDEDFMAEAVSQRDTYIPVNVLL